MLNVSLEEGSTIGHVYSQISVHVSLLDVELVVERGSVIQFFVERQGEVSLSILVNLS